jgi:Fe-S-cluster-containing dehydrogenase component
MHDKKPKNAMLIDYEYCTGCHSCEVACAQEYGWAPGVSGMRVTEIVQELPRDRAYLSYIAFPTETCSLCAGRISRGHKPACVHHCLANVIQVGPIEELVKELGKKPRMVLWRPK